MQRVGLPCFFSRLQMWLLGLSGGPEAGLLLPPQGQTFSPWLGSKGLADCVVRPDFFKLKRFLNTYC